MELEPLGSGFLDEGVLAADVHQSVELLSVVSCLDNLHGEDGAAKLGAIDQRNVAREV